MSNSIEGHPPTLHATGFNAIFLKLMGVKPFEGGPIEELAGGLRLRSGYSSAFLLPINTQETEFILIDAGADKTAEEILAVLAYKGVDASAVKAILVTHGHPDHTAGIRQFPDAEIYIGAEDRAYIEGTAKADGILGAKNPELAVKDSGKIRVVTDGQTLQFGTQSVRAFKVPGHTRGSLAFVINQALFIGDAVTFDKKDRAVKPPRPFTHSMSQALASLKNLITNLDSEAVVVRAVIPNHSAAGSLDAIRTLVGMNPHP